MYLGKDSGHIGRVYLGKHSLRARKRSLSQQCPPYCRGHLGVRKSSGTRCTPDSRGCQRRGKEVDLDGVADLLLTVVSEMRQSAAQHCCTWSMHVATLVTGLALAASTGISALAACRVQDVPGHAGGEWPPVASDTLTRNTNTVRIMTWNIRYNNPGDGIHAWMQRRDTLLSFVLSQRVDVLCIQEGLHEQVAFLKGGLPGFDVRGVGRDDGREKGEYSAIYFDRVRFRPAADGTFWLSPTPSVPGKGWDAALPRIVTWMGLVDSSTTDTLFVFNTHFDHVGTEARERSAHLLRLKIGEIAGSFPVVVAGDFNSIEADPPYRILTSPDLPPPRLEDAMRRSVSPHLGPSATFTGFEPTDPGKGPRIDYLFVSEPLTVLRHFTCPARGTNGFLSDHLPVVMEFSLRPHR